MTDEERKQVKLARLKKLREGYRMLEKGASPAERTALRMESAVLQKRIEVAGREAR
jgi:hypothetical protein